MKKFATTFLLLLTLTFGIFADDGGTDGGDKPCPIPTEPCRVEQQENVLVKTFKELISFIF